MTDNLSGLNSRRIAFAVVFAVALLSTACQSKQVPSVDDGGVVPIRGTDNPHRRGDVIFVHGLGGNFRETWEHDGDPPFFWPEDLSLKYPDIGVWSIRYKSGVTNFAEEGMPFQELSQSLLPQMVSKKSDLGKKPHIFIAHSLGGILVKQMLEDALELNKKDWKPIASKTKGVVFLATPHEGSDKADLLSRISLVMGKNEIVDQLERNGRELRRLHIWYKQNAKKNHFETLAMYETKPVPHIGIIVDKGSADPGIDGAIAIPVSGATHLTICKPQSRDSVVYDQVAGFIDTFLLAEPPPLESSFEKYIEDYNAAIAASVKNEREFADFLRNNADHQVIWSGEIRKVFPEQKDKSNPAYWISPVGDSDEDHRVYVEFEPEEFQESLQIGAKITIKGVIDAKTGPDHTYLSGCTILPSAADN